MNVIERIEFLRKQRNWTKYRLAEEAMITYSTLSAMYQRETPPKLDILEMICNAFGITLSEFFMENDTKNVLTERETELLKYFRRLSEGKKQAVLALLGD